MSFDYLKCGHRGLPAPDTSHCVGLDYKGAKRNGSFNHNIITDPPTHSVEGQTSDALWRLSSLSVVVCNTSRRACRRLHPRTPGDDVMPPAV